MKTATVRDLRNRFARLSAWIGEGETIEITKGGKVFARLIPATQRKKRIPKPDIMARLKANWGNRVFTHKEVTAMRAAELGEEAE